jgi:oxygen-independent coproporphyrinogen-3 oxidase
LDALCKEIQLNSGYFTAFDSLYIGGGTPTVLGPSHWRRLMACLADHFDFSDRTEITVEANPDDVTHDLMRCLRSMGVNRVSLGVQSFHDRELEVLGRRHNGKQAGEALECIKAAGFANVGIDLMYGIPGQSKESWLETLKRARAFSPAHVSCYQFTIEVDTPFEAKRDNGATKILDEEEERTFFILTSNFLKQSGYIHYEVSNFAGSIRQVCLHNMKYWQRNPYLGIGPAAHSYDGSKRWWNVKSVEAYCRSLESGCKPMAGSEILSQEQHDMESLLLGFRMMDGIEHSRLRKTHKNEKVLKDLVQSGLLQWEADRIVPTCEGFLVADSLPLLFAV